jgi:hypothetical protein
MTPPTGVDDLTGILQRQSDALPAHRPSGPTPRSRMQDADLGAWGVLFTHSSSVLDAKRHLQQRQGPHNAWTLFGVETMPCTNPRRPRLAPMRPRALVGGYHEIFAGLTPHGGCSRCRALSVPRLLALEGPPYFASPPGLAETV